MNVTLRKGYRDTKNMSALWLRLRSVSRHDTIKINKIVNFYAPHISFYFKIKSVFELASRLLYNAPSPHIPYCKWQKPSYRIIVNHIITIICVPYSIIALNINGRNCRDNKIIYFTWKQLALIKPYPYQTSSIKRSFTELHETRNLLRDYALRQLQSIIRYPLILQWCINCLRY